MPTPPTAVADAVAFGVPVILAGGDPVSDREALYANVSAAVEAGAAGVAFGRNVWGDADPAGTVDRLRNILHGAP